MSGKRPMDADSSTDSKRPRGDTGDGNGDTFAGGSMKDQSPKDGYGHGIYEIEVNIIHNITRYVRLIIHILLT